MGKQEDLVEVEGWDERDEVLRNRYEEAVSAGMNNIDALFFAASNTDVGMLRKAVRKGCPPRLIARIVL